MPQLDNTARVLRLIQVHGVRLFLILGFGLCFVSRISRRLSLALILFISLSPSSRLLELANSHVFILSSSPLRYVRQPRRDRSCPQTSPRTSPREGAQTFSHKIFSHTRTSTLSHTRTSTHAQNWTSNYTPGTLPRGQEALSAVRDAGAVPGRLLHRTLVWVA